jgi:hypothetical protein
MADHVTTFPSSTRWAIWLLVVLCAASFALRLHDLEAKSLWSDEGLTLRRAEQPLRLIVQNLNLIPTTPDYHGVRVTEASTQSPSTLPFRIYLPLVLADAGDGLVATPDIHPPLYFLLMHAWTPAAGQSEFALRFPSVVAATLTLPLIYVLGRSLLSHETGLWAALLAAVSPYYLWYAQEARMYTWLVALGLASVYTLLPLLEKKPRLHDYLAFVTVTAAMVYTHYGGFLLLAFEIGIYTAYHLRARSPAALVALAALALVLMPLLPYLRRTLSIPDLFAFTQRPLPVILQEVCSAFSLGPSRSAIQPLWRTAPFLVLFGTGTLMLDTRRRRRAWLIGLGSFFVPIAAQYALSLFKPSYMNPRHLMIASPAWELVMAQGLTTLRRRFWPGWVIILGLALFFRGQTDDDIFTAHRFWKDDIRGAVHYIEENAHAGDAVVLHHPVVRLTFNYYYNGPYPKTTIPRYGNHDDTAGALARFKDWSQRYDRIWFLYGPPPTYFPHEFLPDWADTHLFKVAQREFEAWWTYVGVAAYDDEPPVLSALPTDGERHDAEWEALRLAGLRMPNMTAGDDAKIHFYWQTASDLPKEPLTLKVRLLDQAGKVWYEQMEDLLPFYPMSSWPHDQLVHTALRVSLPEDMPPIAYKVDVEPVGLGQPQTLGQVRVTRPVTRTAAPRPQARFENGIDLMMSELQDDTFRAGYPVIGALSWHASTDPDQDYHLRARLITIWGREITSSDMTPSAVGFPTSAWEAGDRVAGRLTLPLPADLKGGRYRVQISLIEAESGRVVPVRHWYGTRDWFTIDTIQVEAWPLMTELPDDIDHRLGNVAIGDDVRLRGYDLAHSEDALTITLYWQAKRDLEHNYHVFVHLGNPDQPPLAQAGGVPVEWTRPTTSWRANEIIIDSYTVPLTDLAPGEYALSTGLYDPETGRRPETRVDGAVVPGGYVLLQKVTVE